MRCLNTVRLRLTLTSVLAGLSLGTVLVASAEPTLADRSSAGQVVFSATGATFTLTGGGTTPFGFWIWCQATDTNAYGVDCAGSMYFYGIPTLPSGGSPTEPVEGSIVGTAAAGYTMTVHNRTGPLAMECTLQNTPPATPGPTNKIVVACSSPSGSGTVTNAVVSGSGV